MLLDQKALPLVSLARSAEADHHSPKLARRLGPARERGVATAEEDEMFQLRAGEAEWSWLLHHEQVPAPWHSRQVQSLSGEMTTSSWAHDRFEAARAPACAITGAGGEVRSAALYSWYMSGLGVSPPPGSQAFPDVIASA